MVDWSGGNDTGKTPRKDAIWAGLVLAGVEHAPVYLRNRDVAFDWLTRLIETETQKARRLFIGFDFPFGYPKGFAKRVTGADDPFALWAYFAEHLQDTPERNNRFELAGALNQMFPGVGPFWFNGTKQDIPHLPRKGRDRRGHGLAERRQVEDKAKGTFTCWQMGGAGAVGGQVMTGIKTLETLRQNFKGQIGVWPFDLNDQPVAFVETWPSLIAKQVAARADPIKDRAQVRLMARALSRLPQETLRVMLSVTAPKEGWILGQGHEQDLSNALC